MGETFKWLVAWKRSFPRPKLFFENLFPSFTLSYTITKKLKRVNLRHKSYWRSWNSWGSPSIAFPLGFTVMRVLFGFLIEMILFRVPRDRVFFFRVRSNRFFSLSMLFSRHVAIFFYQIMLLLFLSKTGILFCIHYNSQK